MKKVTNVKKIFDAINNYSSSAEIRYVSCCVRKILNNEKVDDIDLATNLDPIEITKALDKNDIKFYETGIEHGTITATLDNEKYEITSLRKDLVTDGGHTKVKLLKIGGRTQIEDFYYQFNLFWHWWKLVWPIWRQKWLIKGKVVFVGDEEKRIRRLFENFEILKIFQNIVNLIMI